MKRGLLVAALVLVPFALLVALGFHFSQPNENAALEDPRVQPPVRTATPELAAPPEVDAGASAAPSAPALLAPYTAQLGRCFSDNGQHGRIHLRFTPQRDGGFAGVAVDQNSTQSPYVAACVEDLLQAARFEPSPGPDYAPIDFTFSF